MKLTSDTTTRKPIEEFPRLKDAFDRGALPGEIFAIAREDCGHLAPQEQPEQLLVLDASVRATRRDGTERPPPAGLMAKGSARPVANKVRRGVDRVAGAWKRNFVSVAIRREPALRRPAGRGHRRAPRRSPGRVVRVNRTSSTRDGPPPPSEPAGRGQSPAEGVPL